MGRREEGFPVAREWRKSEARIRKRTVWVNAERGMLRWRAVEEETKLLSQAGETARDFVFCK